MLSRWMIAVGGPKKQIQHTENITVFQQSDTNIKSTGEFFNNLNYSKDLFDYVLFLDNNYNLKNIDDLSIIENYIKSHDMNGIGALYADLSVIHDGEYLCAQVKPAYDVVLRNKFFVLNVPFVISLRTMEAPRFSPQIAHLSLWDGLLDISGFSLLCHMPYTLFELYNSLDYVNLEADIKYVTSKYFS